MRPNRALAIVLAVIVAGSVAAVPGVAAAASQDNGPVGQDDGLNQTQNETLGTADVTENQTAENDTSMRQPGITEDGELNVTELYAAHQQVLEAEGYRATENTTVRLNGSVAFTADVAYAASAGGNTTSIDANISVAGKNSSKSVFSNESVTYVRTVEDGNVSYAAYERGPPSYAAPQAGQAGMNQTGQNETGMMMGNTSERRATQGDMQMDGMHGMHSMHGMQRGDGPVPGHVLLALEGSVGNATVGNETQVDNRTVQTVTAPLRFEEFRGTPTGNLTLMVDERGVVHAANVTVNSTVYDANATYNFSLTELGVEELDQPAWIQEVPENATEGPPQEQPGQGPGAEPNGSQAPGQDGGPEPGPAGGPDSGPGGGPNNGSNGGPADGPAAVSG